MFGVYLASPNLSLFLLAGYLGAIWGFRSQLTHADADNAQGRRTLSIRTYRRVRRLARWVGFPTTYRTASLRLGRVLRSSDQPEAAIAVWHDALVWQRHGDRSLRFQAILWNDIGVAHDVSGNLTEAKASLEASVQLWRRHRGSDPSHAKTLENLASVANSMGDRAGYVATLREALCRWDAMPEPELRQVVSCCTLLAEALHASGDDSEAIGVWRRIVDSNTTTWGPVAWQNIEPLRRLMEIYRSHALNEEYDRAYLQWTACWRAQPAYKPVEIANAVLAYAARKIADGQADAGESQARLLLGELPDNSLGLRARCHQLCAQARFAASDFATARSEANIAIETLSGDVDARPLLAELNDLAGEAAEQQNDLSAANLHYHATLAWLNANVARDHPWLVAVEQKVGRLREISDPKWLN